MASKSAQTEPEKAEVIEESLDTLDLALDRVKVLYEQYFLGIQKQPPTHLHSDIERKLRDLQQMQIRNTGLRYRFATLQQKFGSYNSYWRRTLRQIENGTYARNLSKIGRRSVETGQDIPEEILAAMPKRMRDQVKRDREAALAIAKRRERAPDDSTPVTGDAEDDDAPAFIGENTELRRSLRPQGPHVLDEADSEFDLDAFFAEVTDGASTTPAPPPTRTGLPIPSVTNRTQPMPLPVAPSAGTRSAPIAAQAPVDPASRTTKLIPVITPSGTTTSVIPVIMSDTGSMPVTGRTTSAIPTIAAGTTGNLPTTGASARQTGPVPTIGASPNAAPPAGASSSAAAMRTTMPMPTFGANAPPGSPPPGAPAPGAPPVPRPSPIPTAERRPNPLAPSQVTRAIPIIPGASSNRPATPVESMEGPFPRTPIARPDPARPDAARSDAARSDAARPDATRSDAARPDAARPDTARHDAARPAATRPPPPPPRAAPPPPPAARTTPLPPRAAPPVGVKSTAPPAAPPKPAEPAPRPPAGMSDADVNALYGKYVKAKQMLGEEAGPGAYGKLLKTINATAPRVMEQYKAKGVEFSIVVKDNQVIIKAKPKT